MTYREFRRSLNGVLETTFWDMIRLGGVHLLDIVDISAISPPVWCLPAPVLP